MVEEYVQAPGQTEEIKLKFVELDCINRIADALESIGCSLESIDQTLEDATEILMDCQVKNQYGSAIAVAGTIQQI